MKNYFNSRRRKIQAIVVAAVVLLPNVTFAFPGALDIGLAIFSFFAELAGLAGVVLNLAVAHLVIGFGHKMQLGFGASVENAWTIIRDLVNICFIFGLVYIGFKVILDNASQARKMLPPLIIAALLINFSLFFTKVITDVTNVAAVEIYEAALGPDAAGRPAGVALNPDEEAENSKNVGISGSYMQIMGLKALIAPDRTQEGGEEQFLKLLGHACTNATSFSEGDLDGKCTNTIFLYFMVASIFMLVAIYAFLAGAFLLVVRFISLIILMILSPLMFLSMALPLPGTAKFSNQWWSSFLSAAFMAPAYFMFLYIGLAVGSKVGVDNGAGVNMFEAASGNYSALEGILNLIIVAAFMLFAVSTARSMAKAGSSATLSIADNVRRRGQRLAMGAAAGGAAWGMRNTVGRQADKAANSDRMRNLASSNNKLYAWAGRQALKRSRAVADSNFDVRNTMAAAGVDTKEIGKGGKKGYVGIKKDRDKERDKFADSLGNLDTSKDAATDQYKDSQVHNIVYGDAQVKAAQQAMLQADTPETRARYAKAVKDAELKAKYIRQIRYRAAMDSADKWSGRTADAASVVVGGATLALAAPFAGMLGGAIGGTAGGAIGGTAGAVISGGGVAAAGATVAGQSVGNFNGNTSSSGAKPGQFAGSLHKKYGERGEAAEKSKKQKKEAETIAKAMKDLGVEGGEAAEKKDDDKSS